MMDLQNLDFRKNRSYIKAARAAQWLLRSWSRFLLSLSVLVGFILFVLAFQSEDAYISAGPIAIAIFLFMLLKFSGSYFKQLELKNVYKQPLGNNISVFEGTDFEAALILGKVDLKNPDLKKLFRRVLNTSKVNFIASKLNISYKDLAALENNILFSNPQEGLNLIVTAALTEIQNNGES